MIEYNLMPDFIYEIPAIVPLKNIPHSQWGFAVDLDPYFAIKLRGMKISSDISNRLQDMGREIIKNYMGLGE